MAFKNILVTLDGSPQAEAALLVANSAAEAGTHITLLTVLEEAMLPALAMAGAAGLAAPLSAYEARDVQAVAHMRAYLEQTVRLTMRDGVTVTCDVRAGGIVDTILGEAERGKYDLIVMSTHGRTGFGKILLGSVVSDVLPYAPCPVLVVPPSINTKHDATRPL